MKNLNIRLIAIIVLLTTITCQSYSQITITKINDKNINSSLEGFVYSLPQTVLKIDVVYENIQKLKGPLSQYADDYLGVTDYISADKTEYNLVDVNISSFQESDPGQLYFVQYPAERAKDEKKTWFSLSNIGGLLAYNTELPIATQTSDITTDQVLIFPKGEKGFPYMSQYNKQKKIDTIIRTINIDTLTINRFLFSTSWVDKNMDDKARDAALQIEKIRESRYHLLSGYQEVNYGSSIIYMDNRLKKLEEQYLELFLGRELKTIEKQTFYFVPEKNKKGGELLKFNDGKLVVIRIMPDKTADMLPDVPTSKQNSIYYRIPASADVSISSDNKDFYTGRFVINQLGTVSSVPLSNAKLQFDENTGNLITIIRE
ncbi:MAG: DUF4831 family protein [Bacteroidetes bacterium]|nr:DUF4831 family protein [Bacteroidota bacterium]